ncbi:hypothetical protein BN871_DD_00170 [Paenibacillus sp. P22]|nr:hypothetical protein BN871_DD_00170 [Paenibacillus sp. P22]
MFIRTPGGSGFLEQRPQPVQGVLGCAQPHHFPAAAGLQRVYGSFHALARDADVDKSDRLALGLSRTRHARYGYAPVAAGRLGHPLGHQGCRRLAYRPWRSRAFQHLQRNAEQLMLERIGVRDDASQELSAAAGPRGDQLGEQPARAALGAAEPVPAVAQKPQNGFLQRDILLRIQVAADPGLDRRSHIVDPLQSLRFIRRFGRQADRHLSLLGIRSDRRIGLGFDKIDQLMLQLGFADAGKSENAGVKRRSTAVFLKDPACRGAFEHWLHLHRRSGQQNIADAVLFKGVADGESRFVVQCGASLDRIRLPQVALHHMSAAAREEGFHSRQGRLVDHQLASEHVGKHILGEIVHCRPQASREDEQIGPGRSDCNGFFQPGGVVADDRLEKHVDAQGCQPLGQVARVGVDDLAKQQLGSDRDDFGFHVGISPPGLGLSR